MALTGNPSEYDSNGHGILIHTEDSDDISSVVGTIEDINNLKRAQVTNLVDMFWNRKSKLFTNDRTYNVFIGQSFYQPTNGRVINQGIVLTLWEHQLRQWIDFNLEDINGYKLGKRNDN